MIRSPLDLDKPLVVRKRGIQVLVTDGNESVTHELAIGDRFDWRALGFTERQVRQLYQAWRIDVVGSNTAPMLSEPAPAAADPPKTAKRPAQARAASA